MNPPSSPPSATPIWYLHITDAAFFKALIRHDTVDDSVLAVLDKIDRAHCRHHVEVLSELPLHTANMCWLLVRNGISVENGLAPILAAQAGIPSALDDLAGLTESNDTTWLRLTPVSWTHSREHIAIRSCLQPHDRPDSLSPTDWTELARTIAPWLMELGWEIFTDAHCAYIRSAQTFDYHAPSLEVIEQGTLEQFLPHGRDASRWQALLTELQMFLHTHPFNQSRSARGLSPINTFWLDQQATIEQSRPNWKQHLAQINSLHHIIQIDETLRLDDLAHLLMPIAQQLNNRSNLPARLTILSNEPCAGAHHFEFSPPNLSARLWQIWINTIHPSIQKNKLNQLSWLSPLWTKDD